MKMRDKPYGWRRLLFIAASLLTMSLLHASDSPPKLEVVLSQPSSTHDAATGFITVTITNKSDHALFLPRSKTPLENPDGHLWNLIFQVRSSTNEQVKFVGRMIKVWRQSIDMFYIRVEPGQSLSKTIHLSADYDLSQGGNFTVVYDQPYADNVYMSEGEATDGGTTEVRSNELSIWVSSSLTAAARSAFLAPKATSAPGLPEGCDVATQLYPASMAMLTASTWAAKALGYLEDIYEIETTHDEDGSVKYRPYMKPDFKYTYWFGRPDDNAEAVDERPYQTSVWDKTDFYPLKVMDAVTMRAGSLNRTYACGCRPEYDARTAAWADHSNPYLVHLCDFFFTLDANSQAGTFVHEWSHFADEHATATIDHADGREKSHALAGTNRALAVDNADTYGLFTQDVAENPQHSED
jgi:peptidyl-Lys metalloendopeptidase